MSEPRLHGLKPAVAGHNGEFFFAILNLFKAIQMAQSFPGLNKYPNMGEKTGLVWSREQAGRFFLAFGKMKDTFWKIDRVAELLDEARKKVFDFKEGTVTSEQMASFQQGERDFPLYVDALLLYLRIFADCLANLTSQFQFYKPNQVPRDSFRDQKDWFIEKRRSVDPGYADILEKQAKWFTTLAGEHHGEGLRDLIVHKMVQTQLFYQPGETPDQNRVHAFLYDSNGVKGASLVPEIQKLTEELFLFLDSYVAHFVPRIEQMFGAALPEFHTPNFPLFFQFVKDLPSAWLYPRIETNEPESVSAQPV